MNIDDLIKILQASSAPVVLISGVGLLLLTMTNRLGRSIDRIRTLCDEYKGANKEEIEALKVQINILYQRCQFLRTAIVLAALSIVCVSVIIFVLFSIHVFHINLMALVEVLFETGLLLLIFSLLFFLLDLWAALRSIKIEIEHTLSLKKSSTR